MTYFMNKYTAWYTKSNKPKDDYNRMNGTKIHYCYEDGNKTICGFKIEGSRWYICNQELDNMRVDCKYCLKLVDKI